MIRLLFLGDVHFSYDPPRARRVDYPERILAKLAHIAAVAKRLEVDACVSTGDLFHRKSPEERDITALIRAFSAFPHQRILSVLGNHDTTTPGHMEGTAYECLVEAGVVQDFSDKSIAWDDLTMIGRPYRREAEMSYAPDGCDVVVSHGMLVPKGPKPFPCTTPDEIRRKWGERKIPRPAILVNGHSHVPFDDGDIVNLGSICRISRGEAGPRRLLYVRAEAGKIERRFIPLPIAEDDEVFRDLESPDLDLAVGEGERDARIADFVEGVASAADVLLVDPITLLRARGSELGNKDAVEAAERYLLKAQERLKG